MIVVRILAVVVGAVLAGAVLISALETVVLPREGYTRIARFVFAVADRVLIHRWRNQDREANLRALYAPIALITLPLVWMISVTIAFSLIFWGIKTGTMGHSFEVSGSSLFTLGFAEPAGNARIWLTFVEATIGLGLVALLISYLPTIYSAHHQREKGIIVLRPFAGTPPSPIDLLNTLHRLGTLENPELWRTTASWLLEIDQTHTAFPALCYFPEALADQSWVASVGSVLDAAALYLSASDLDAGDRPVDAVKGPMLALAYGMPSLVEDRDIGRASHRTVGTPARPPGPGIGRATAGESQPHGVPGGAGAARRGPGPTRVRVGPGSVLETVRLDPLRVRPGAARSGRSHHGTGGRVDHRQAGPGGATAPDPGPPHRGRLGARPGHRARRWGNRRLADRATDG